MTQPNVRPAAADLFTREQVCERIGISLRTLHALINEDQVIPPGFSLGGKRKYWKPADVDAYIQKRSVPVMDWSSIGCMSQPSSPGYSSSRRR